MWRWLHESRHGIKNEDRPSLLLKFKSLVYSDTLEQFRELYKTIITRDKAVKKYPSFVKYLESLESMKESWALCFRSELLIRCHNTNNNVEAQFLIIKDIILQRVREYSVVALFDKLVVDFNDYYKNKLLSIASSSFDGNYRNRFAGKSKEKSGMGYKKTTEDEFKYMEANLVDHGHNVFSVPSAKKDHTSYLVDMEAGTCICPVGINGAPCKHQYILWILGKGACRNFLPLFSPEDRKKYAEIAIGISLPIEAYAGLHDHNSSVTSANTDDGPTCLNTDAEKRDIEERETTNSHDTSVQVDEVTNALTDFYDFVLKKLPHIDSSYLNGLVKFTKKVKNMTDSNVSSAFHLFGSRRHHHRHIVNRICSVSKRAQKGNIPVQPGAVQ